MTFKMLALDIDGTLLEDDLSILPELPSVISKLQEDGIIVTLSTGRAFPSAKKYADLIGICVPLVCYNGAQIRAAEAASPLFEANLSLELMTDIIRFCEPMDWYLQLYNNDKIVVSEICSHTVADPDFANMPTLEMGKLSAASLGPSPKIMTRCEKSELAARRKMLEQEFGARLYVTGSTSQLLEMMPIGISKAEALKTLCEQLDISPSQLLACGDGDNDREMLQFAGMGCAMANAAGRTKAAADYVCGQKNGHGVLEAIKRFL